MNRWTVLLATLVISVLVAMGCSGGGASPVTPSADLGNLTGSANTGQVDKNQLWGYWDCYVDTVNNTIVAVPNRAVESTLNVVPFLNKMSSPKNGITFENFSADTSDPSDMFISVDFVLHHPFPTLTQYAAYDIRGIFIGEGSNQLQYDSNLEYAMMGVDQFMVNPDGYTRWWNSPEFTMPNIFGYVTGGFQNAVGTATLNPYKYYAKGLTAGADELAFLQDTENNNDGVFLDGSYPRTMELHFPKPTPGLKFSYAVTAEWDGNSILTHPPEAVACGFDQTNTTLFYDGTTSGGHLVADITLFDWLYQPSTIKVESTVFSGIQDVAMVPVDDGGVNWSTYSIDIPSEPFTSNEQECWVIAEYSAFGYHNHFVPTSNAPEAPLAAFFRFDLNVPAVSPCQSLVPVVSTINGSSPFATGPGNHPSLVLGGSDFEAGAGLNIGIYDGATLIAPAYPITFVDSNTINFGVNLTGVLSGTYDVKVTNGCGDMLEGIGVGLLNVAPIFVIGDPNIDLTPAGEIWGTPVDIGCDPTANRSAVAYNHFNNYIVKWEDTFSTHDIIVGGSMFGSSSGPIGRLDVAGEAGATSDSLGAGINFSVFPGAGYEPAYWTQCNWDGVQGTPYTYVGGPGVFIWRNDAMRKIMDICNIQDGTNQGVVFHWTYATDGWDPTPWDAISECRWWDSANTAHWLPELSWPTGTTPTQWCDIDGTAGVWVHNILGTGMAPGTSTERMQWILEDLPTTNTATVELWDINIYPITGAPAPNASSLPPVYGGITFGEGLLYDAKDLTVDSLGNVFVLNVNSTGGIELHAWAGDGTYIGTTGVLTASQVAGTPIAIDADTFADPDEIDLLSSEGVTRFVCAP